DSSYNHRSGGTMSDQLEVAASAASIRRIHEVAHTLQRGGFKGRTLNAVDVRAIAERALAAAGGGRAPNNIRRELQSIDRSSRFSKDALCLFQDLLAR